MVLQSIGKKHLNLFWGAYLLNLRFKFWVGLKSLRSKIGVTQESRVIRLRQVKSKAGKKLKTKVTKCPVQQSENKNSLTRCLLHSMMLAWQAM